MKRVALVIGSGGVKCAAALGLFKVFQREGIPVSLVVGASGGSLYAAALALGYTVDAAERMTLDFWTADLMEGYTSNLRAALAGESPFTEGSGLLEQAPLLERITRVFGERTFTETDFPLYIVATDLYSGEAVCLSTGRIVEAVRASISIPMVFPPAKVGDRLLVDGAVSNPLPVDVAIREGADLIIAMGFELPVRKRSRSYTAVTAHFNSLYMNNILKSSFAFYNLAHHAELVPILPEFDRAIGSFDAHLIPYVIKQGELAAEAQIAYLHRLLGSASG